MPPVVVLLEEDRGLELRRVHWRDRLAVRARASALDEQLASGASPESSITLALHAGRLCRPAQRRLLARSLTRIAEAADAPVGNRLKMPVCRVAVHHARTELAAVAGRLSASGAVNVHGVARLRILLADGTGPLYRPAPPERLRRELAGVRTALDSFG